MESKIEVNLPLTLKISKRNDSLVIPIYKKMIGERYILEEDDILEVILIRIYRKGANGKIWGD